MRYLIIDILVVDAYTNRVTLSYADRSAVTIP